MLLNDNRKFSGCGVWKLQRERKGVGVSTGDFYTTSEHPLGSFGLVAAAVTLSLHYVIKCDKEEVNQSRLSLAFVSFHFN